MIFYCMSLSAERLIVGLFKSRSLCTLALYTRGFFKFYDEEDEGRQS